LSFADFSPQFLGGAAWKGSGANFEPRAEHDALLARRGQARVGRSFAGLGNCANFGRS